MANRRDFYYLQKVTEGELDGAFNELETADRNLALDLGLFGIMSGMSIAQHGAGDLTVDVTGLGAATDQAGQRIGIASLQNVNVAVDFNNVTTAVSTPGNSKIVSVFAQFDRALSDPRVDGNSLTVYFVRDETFKFKIVQGAEAVSPSPPGLLSDGVLLGDITRTFGVNVILTGAIALTARRQDAIVVAGSPFALRRGKWLDAMTDMVTRYNQHVTDLADRHTALTINYSGGGNWANGDTNPATTAEQQLDKMITDLAGIGSGTSGSEHLGSRSLVGSFTTITAGTLLSVLTAMRSAANLEYGGGGSWAGGTSATNPAASIETQLDKIITDLSSTSSGASGAHRIGIDALPSWLGGRSNPSTNVEAAFAKIVNDLAATTTADDGAERIGLQARTTWLGGRTNPTADVFAGIDKIITDLAATTASDDGAERIGCEAGAGYSVGSVRSQLDQVGPSATTTWTGAKTFDNITASSTNRYKLASRSITRTVSSFGATNTPADWTLPTTSVGFWRQANTFSAGVYVDFPIDPPDGCTITSVTLVIDPADGHAAVPGTVPSVALLRSQGTVGGSASTIGTQNDTSASAGAYDATHSIALTGLSHTVDRTNFRYHIKVTGEGGANFVALLQIIGLQYTFTTTATDDGAG